MAFSGIKGSVVFFFSLAQGLKSRRETPAVQDARHHASLVCELNGAFERLHASLLRCRYLMMIFTFKVYR